MFANRTVLISFILLWAPAAFAEQAVSFTADDGISINAVISLPANSDDKSPAVIFIHQGGSDKSEWTRQPLFNAVVREGMVALAYDVRGHGESAGEADFSTLFDDPKQAPLDLKAAITHLTDTGKVDVNRVAVVGASIGSNLAVMAMGNPDFNVKTAVAISGKTSAVYNLAGAKNGELAFASVYHIASAGEQNGLRAKWAEELFERTARPRKIEIIEGSSGHGVAVFNDDPGLASRILNWLKETL